MKAGPGDLVVTRWGARFSGRDFPCSVGKGGILASKREGDGVSPAGAWRICGGMFRADRIARPQTIIPMRPAGPRDIWSDDPADPRYNQLCRKPRRHSHETLRRADPLYDIVLFTSHNQERIPGCGSAIFVHLWRGPRKPTEGCAAFHRPDLLWILARWRADSRLIFQP